MQKIHQLHVIKCIICWTAGYVIFLCWVFKRDLRGRYSSVITFWFSTRLWGTARYTLASAPDCIPYLMLRIGNAGLGCWCRIVQNLMKVIAQEWYPCSCLLEGMLNSVHRCVFICTNTRLPHCFPLTDWSRFISAGFSHTFTYPLFSWVAMVACPSEKLLVALHLWSSEVLFVTQELGLLWRRKK